MRLPDFLCLLSNYLAYRAQILGCGLDVHVFPHASVDGSLDGESQRLRNFTFYPPAASLPLPFYEAQPALGHRHVSLNIVPLGDKCAHILWQGMTWAYRQDLDQAGIRGAYYEEGGAAPRRYFRGLPSVDVTSSGSRKHICRVLRKTFRGLAMPLIIDELPRQGSPLAKFLGRMRKVTSLHYDTSLVGYMRRHQDVITHWRSLAFLSRCSDGFGKMRDGAFRAMIFRFFLPPHICVDELCLWPEVTTTLEMPTKRPRHA